jgi:hypothetical protein
MMEVWGTNVDIDTKKALKQICVLQEKSLNKFSNKKESMNNLDSNEDIKLKVANLFDQRKVSI